jgi:hypothetical protein
MTLLDIPLTRTADFANHHFLNQLVEAWHDEVFESTDEAPRARGQMGEETQEIHARAIAACFGAAAARRPKLHRYLQAHEPVPVIPLMRFLFRQAD